VYGRDFTILCAGGTSGTSRRDPFATGQPNGSFRRIFLLAAHPGEGPLTEPTAGAQPWPRERVLMPHKRPYRRAREPAELGGKAAFPIC
jgi:hypothetical protein